MHLIDNIDLVFALVRFESCTFDEFTDIVDSGVGCRIDLDDIEHRSVIECNTIRTLVTWVTIPETQTIDPLREYTSTRRLTCSTRTMEQVRMTCAIMCEAIFEDSFDTILSDNRIPIPRTILGVEAHEKWRIMNCQYYMKKGAKDNQKIQPNWMDFTRTPQLLLLHHR